MVEAFAHLASRVGLSDVALRLAGAAEAARETLDVVTSRSLALLPHFPISRDLRERWLLPLRLTVGEEDAACWWAAGRVLSLDEAVALARSSVLAAPDSTTQPLAAGSGGLSEAPRQMDADPGGAGLTSRETEVLRLVAQGQSNKEIAAELVLSVRTVERHITNLYGKIDARGKADATAYAIHHGLV